MLKKILITEPIHSNLSTKLTDNGFQCVNKPEITLEELKNTISEYYGIVIRSRFIITNELIDRAIKLKFIARAGAGMENVATSYAESKNVFCINSPEGNRGAVGEHAVGMLLSLFSNISKSNYEVKNGTWQRNANRGYEIFGKTIGIIGYGNMGGAFARRLSGFGANVIAYDKYRKNYTDKYAKACSLEDLFEKADVVSLHVPLTEETHFLANDTFFNSFSKEIYILNTARGPVLQTKALVDALKTEKVLGAGLDVLEYENNSFEKLFKNGISEDFKYLVECDNVILTPHIAGRTYESEVKMADIMAEKIIKNIIVEK